MKKRSNFLFVLFSILVLVSSYFRDFSFKGINALLQFKSFPGSKNHSHQLFSPLFDWSHRSIYIFKWGMLLVFSLAFMLFCYFSLKSRFPNSIKEIKKYIIICYGGLGLISGVALLFYYVPSISQPSYMISRRILGILHSPLPLMILFLLLYIQEKTSKKSIKN